ncbi:MAG: phosphoribosylaminoimidazole carboxylase ade2 [Chrysothrix sp. TS-e1954]|nr:MAG: phosphoribosylaminoimidazole carboxylase ade2 [Chrysothrix sp. TS-e1954]
MVMPQEPLPVIGVLGGGQLGRMFVEACNTADQAVIILDSENAPAKQIAHKANHVAGSFSDQSSIEKLAQSCDILTIEIEHVNVDALERVASKVKVQPAPSTIRIIQDKFRQREHLRAHGIPLALYREVPTHAEKDLEAIAERLEYPFMLKSKTQAYDGRGNYPVRSPSDVPAALVALHDRPLYAEKWEYFHMELAVMVVKTRNGQLAYPVVETIHEDSICKLVYAPARNISQAVIKKARDLACKAVSTFEGKGVFGVEMFLSGDGATILVNEIAPRPHNSGHYSIEACRMSQYEAHRRAILDKPIYEDDLRLLEPAIMLNVLGGKDAESHLELMEQAEAVRGATVHPYGKGDARPGRKMAHITVTAPTMHQAEGAVQPLLESADRLRRQRTDVPQPTTKSPTPSVWSPFPVVSIAMGSDSDLKVLTPGLELLDKEFSVSFEVTIKSAHRTPDEMASYAKEAAARGIQVIIAAAGGAAHLPGMIAAHTSLPVIGIPVKASSLDGMDSLLSIVQMPRGVPVATVGVNNAINAALLAARIVGLVNSRVMSRVERYQQAAHKEVVVKEAELHALGWRTYAAGMS